MQTYARRGSTDGCGLFEQTFFIAAGPSKKDRKGSFAGALNIEKSGPNQGYAPVDRVSSKFNPRITKAYKPGTRKSRYESFHLDVSESDANHPLEGVKTVNATPNESDGLKEETISTASSSGQQTNQGASKRKETIDNFKVTILGDVYDGVRYKTEPKHSFAAAILCKAPEASDLSAPDF
jgi:hypothetical protein